MELLGLGEKLEPKSFKCLYCGRVERSFISPVCYCRIDENSICLMEEDHEPVDKTCGQ